MTVGLTALFAIAVCACNQVYGLDSTQGRYADAPFGCPGIGGAPRFKPDFEVVTPLDCDSYMTSARANRVLASCREPTVGIYTGTIDGPLVRAQGLVAPANMRLRRVALASDGDLALAVMCSDAATSTCTLVSYIIQPDGTWSRGADLPIVVDLHVELGQPSSAPERHVFVVQANEGRFEEYAQRAETWELVASYTSTELGAMVVWGSFSADGLRMIATGKQTNALEAGTLYLDRPSLDARFSPARMIDAPPLDRTWLTEDCGRLYFTAFRNVLYLEQL
jgi:hypothetical protein